jgi:hypothetical protein
VTSVLEVDVSRAETPGLYRVEVIQSPAGEASGRFRLETSEILEQLDQIQGTLLASTVPSRRMLSRGESSVQRLGQRLFDALFAAQEVAGVYRASRAVAAERGETLRIVLRTTAPEVAALPWESMYDRAADSYVSRREPLVRYVSLAASPPPLAVRMPLRVLALVSSPKGLAPLDVDKEKDNLTRALGPMIARGAVSVTWLARTTWPTLQDALLGDSWHIVHFIGHGDFDVERDEGVLALETEEGRIHRVAAANFVDLLREAQPMPRLVVLNACESATSSGTDMFTGVAAALVRGGVSAVTAMQFEISDPAAIAFCRGFYAAIGRGRGVDEAVRSGRVAILGLGEGSLEWITPSLYLRGGETHLFSLTDAPLTEAGERRAEAAAAADSGDAATAVPLYDAVLARDPDDQEARAGRERVVAEAHAGHASDALPAVAPAAPRETVYPDRMDDLWSAAKRISWSARPLKVDVKPLAMALPPDEEIIGSLRMPFGFATCCAVVVTDRSIYLSTSTPKDGSWMALLEALPDEHRLTDDRARIPMDDVEGPPAVVDGHPVLTLRRRGPLALAQYGSREQADLFHRYVVEAQATGSRPA